MAEKIPKSAEPPAAEADKPDPGRLERDDRGNVTWSWTNEESLQRDDSLGAAERMSALVDPSLDVVEDDNPASLRENPEGLKQGYNPYDSGALGKQTWKKKKNLRELSKWIELRKKVVAKKEDK